MNILFILKIIFFYFLFYLSKRKIYLKEKSDNFIYDLRINHLKEPFAIGVEENSFSFLAKEKGPFRAYLLIGKKIVQTKKVKLEECHSFTFRKPLEYNKHYKFIVQGSTTRNELDFETPIKLNAPFIKPKNKNLYSPIFIKNFEIKEEIESARLYITGLGLYQAFINNNKVGNAYLTPGYNDYNYYLRYQTYNITNLLKNENNIEIHMGEGWYKGRFGLKDGGLGEYNLFGDYYKLCLNIVIEYKNGKKMNIVSDNSWKVKSSKEVENGIYDGEVVDFTLPERPLEDVVISKEKYNLVPDFGALITEKDILYPELYISPKGQQILDFKQNMVGFVRFKGFLKNNQEITMSHGEVLQNKNFFNENLRSAKQILKFKGDGEKRIYEPKFTFFGFQYVLIEGLEKVDPKDFEGVVIYTNLEKTIECKTDNSKINKLIQNSFWGQRGNFLDVPTDCPQRDERLGWTADTQVFVNTACYNMDSYIFYKKYIKDLRGDQIMYYEGDIPAYSPSLKNQAIHGGSVWADAGTIIPWNIYLNYGDKNLLKFCYPMMKDYVKTLINKDKLQGNHNLIIEGFTHGDWLAQDGEDDQSSFGGTDTGFINSVYYYRSVELVSLAANELGYKSDYEKYNILRKKIYNAILDRFFSVNGELKLHTQTSYVLCLQYKIYKEKDIIIEDFKERIKNDLYRIKTGFTGTPLILLTLFDNGMDDIAYRILFNEDFPGWLYAINLGATTIWERWNSLREDGSLSNPKMNSFNHYAYGSVCEAIYSRIAGLKNLEPGWKKVMIKPHLNYRLKNIAFSYNSINGKYEIYWKWDNNYFNMNVSIPYGAEAEIILPNGKIHNATEGKHYFECEINNNIFTPFSIDTPLFDIIKNKESAKIVKNNLPKIYKYANQKNNEILKYNIKTANLSPDINYSLDKLTKCDEELKKIMP